MNAVRKMRWTWAADLQSGNFARSEFAVAVSDWAVSGSDRDYQVAGLGSWRVEDDDTSIGYTGQWTTVIGNYSGGSISYATVPGASVSYSYQSPQDHILNLGTRRFPTAAQLSVQVDQVRCKCWMWPFRVKMCWCDGGWEQCPGEVSTPSRLRTRGPRGIRFISISWKLPFPPRIFPPLSPNPQTTLATDWDTLNSQALAPDRTAWQIQALGFTGQANHYAGALVVLRAYVRRATVRHWDDCVFRRVDVRRYDPSIARPHCLHAPEPDRRHSQ
jgi:hypothetical protein